MLTTLPLHVRTAVDTMRKAAAEAGFSKLRISVTDRPGNELSVKLKGTVDKTSDVRAGQA